MSRLIDAEVLIEKWDELSVRGRTEFDQVIMSMPTEINVIEAEPIIELFKKNKTDKEYDGTYSQGWNRAIELMITIIEINRPISRFKAGGIDE